MKQLDIFGGEVDIKELPKSVGGGKPKRKYETMQAVYGEKPGYTCKTCAHLVRKKYANVYYKCELWRDTSCAASDIRVNGTACNMWEAEK